MRLKYFQKFFPHQFLIDSMMKEASRFDDGAQPHRYSSLEDRYRHAYFQALEHACGEMQRRFDQSNLAVVSEVETLVLDSANTMEIPRWKSQGEEAFLHNH